MTHNENQFNTVVIWDATRWQPRDCRRRCIWGWRGGWWSFTTWCNESATQIRRMQKKRQEEDVHPNRCNQSSRRELGSHTHNWGTTGGQPKPKDCARWRWAKVREENKDRLELDTTGYNPNQRTVKMHEEKVQQNLWNQRPRTELGSHTIEENSLENSKVTHCARRWWAKVRVEDKARLQLVTTGV